MKCAICKRPVPGPKFFVQRSYPDNKAEYIGPRCVECYDETLEAKERKG